MKKLLVFTLLPLLATSVLLSAQSGPIVPLLDVKSGYLLGGSRAGKWLNAKNTALVLKSGANYRVYGATRALGKGNATAPKSEGAPCDETLWSKISPESLRKNAEFALGGAHNPLPRALRIESVNQPGYRKVVAAILKQHGIAKPTVQITQIWRVDLDGDGAQEVLLSATRKAEYHGDKNSIASASRAGDYSFVLLRKIGGGRAKNIVIEGEFHPRARQFDAPNFFRLGAIFDADGDGKMEVLIRGRYYEGESTGLYAIRGATARAVLSQGCGA